MSYGPRIVLKLGSALKLLKEVDKVRMWTFNNKIEA